MLQTLTEEQIKLFDETEEGDIELGDFAEEMEKIEEQLGDVVAFNASGGLFSNCTGISSCSGC